MTIREYLGRIGTGLSRLVNVIIGGEVDETLSARIGASSLRGGLAAKIPMPRLWREHFEAAARWEW